MTVPLGYYTIPEVLLILDASGKSPGIEWLEAALLDGELRVFKETSKGKYSTQVVRIPYEDLQTLSRDWREWLPSGKVPPPPKRELSAAWKDAHKKWSKNPSELAYPEWENWPPGLLENYAGTKFLISETELNRRLRPGMAMAETGAPGRPSSMGIVMTEFEKRRSEDRCESSRESEAKALAIWLKKAHPNVPKLEAKTIRNKLPLDFQPFRHCPKL